MSVDRPRPLVAGNWKMNGLRAAATALADVAAGYTAGLKAKADLLVCPPATLVNAFAAGRRHPHRRRRAGLPCRGFRGLHRRLSAEMLADAGAIAVILGHSERRRFHARATRGPRQGPGRPPRRPVGHRLRRRDEGPSARRADACRRARQLADRCRKMRRGTSRDRLRARLGDRHRSTPTAADVAEVHAAHPGRSPASSARASRPGPHPLRRLGEAVERGELMSIRDVDGALVGGASLKAADFLGIAGAYLG